MTERKVLNTYDHYTYTNSYCVTQQQIRLDSMFSRQIQGEKQNCLVEHIKQIENKDPLNTNVTNEEIRLSLTTLLQINIMMTRDQKNVIMKKGLKIQNP